MKIYLAGIVPTPLIKINNRGWFIGNSEKDLLKNIFKVNGIGKMMNEKSFILDGEHISNTIFR